MNYQIITTSELQKEIKFYHEGKDCGSIFCTTLLDDDDISFLARSICILYSGTLQKEGIEKLIMYGIGEQHTVHEFGMWGGPNPDLNKMLQEPGRGNRSVIIKLDPINRMDTILYRWNEETYMWEEVKEVSD